jgi:hypothetical protein
MRGPINHRLANELNARHVVLASSGPLRETTCNEAEARLHSPWYELHIVENVMLGPAEPADAADGAAGEP